MKNHIFLALLCTMILLLCGNASAAEMSDNNQIYLDVSNDNGARIDLYGDDTYYFFNGTGTGGTNALKINDDNSTTQKVINTNSQSGTFYLLNTGGKGYSDEGILMLAVNGTIPEDFQVTINTGGYTWTPKLTGAPLYSEVIYNANTLSETFTKSDFIYGPQTWKPYFQADYPLYEKQDMTNTNNKFYIMFIDLYAGMLKQSNYAEALVNKGAIKITYSFQNLPQGSLAAFNGYGFLLADDNGIPASVGWTTKVNSATGTATDTTGYYVSGTTAPDKYPDAKDDSASITAGSTLNSNAATNDISGDGANVWSKLTDPSNGSLTFNSNGAFTYTPAANFQGTDSFTYRLTDVDGDYDAATVSIFVDPANPTPADLRVETVTTGSSTATGIKNYSVSSLVKNYGGSISKKFYVSYYLSSDATKSSNDRYIGHATINGLGSGSSVDAQILASIPKDLAQGNYYIIAKADVTGLVTESNEVNNIKASASKIFVWRPDLRVKSVTTSGNTATEASYMVSSSVENNGGSISDTFYVSYYLSTDTTKSSNDRYIGHASINGLEGWTTTNAQITATIPKDIAQGNYYIIAVADITGLIPENYESNNLKASASKIFVWRPDLRVKSVTTGGNTARGATNYAVSSVLENNGSKIKTKNTFYVSYYISTDTTKSSKDRYIGHATVNGLDGWSMTSANANCNIPSNIAPGWYYIIAVADSTGLVTESYKSNNNRASAIRIYIS